MIVLNLILIFVGNVWTIVPSVYYNCQFAWRLYSYLFFFIFFLITYLLVYYSSKKYTLLIGSVLACLTFASAMPTLEKRTYYEEGNYIQNVADEAWLKTVTQSGVQNEMTPQIYYDSEYTSEYANSLYYRVKYSLITHKQFVFDKSNYINPVFLYGEGNIKISELNTPYTKFRVNVTSDKALIQLPQFYYKGYVGEYTIDDLKFSINGENIDCLLSFTLGKGEYDFEVNFIGNDGYRIMRPFLYVGIISTIVYGVSATIYTKKKMKKAYKDI